MKQRTSAITSFYWNFVRYLSGSGKSVVFILLFYSLWLVIDRLSSAKFDLKSFDNRPIGSATMEAFDVGARVSLYYSCVLLFFSSFLIFNLLAYFIHQKAERLFTSTELRLLNYSSLAGLSLFIFHAFGIKIFETLEIIYFLHKFFLFGCLLRVFFRKTHVTIYLYAIVLSLASALYFFVADLNNLLGYAANPDFYLLTFVITCLLLLSLQFTLRFGAENPRRISKVAYALVPLALLPFVTLLKDEIFLILKANGNTPGGQGLIYALLLVGLLVLIVFRARKKNVVNLRHTLAKGYFPLLIFSLISYTLYSYFTEYYDELFESGNVYLPLMENRLFGVVAPLEKLNTHLLSDYFLNALYASFNGLKMHEIVLYEFLIMSFSYLLFYYIVLFVSRNEFVAFFSIFLYPYAEAFAPAGFFMAVLGIFALQKICVGKGRFKDYLAFAGILALLILWRIDLAFSCVVALPATLLFFHVRDKAFRINWRYLALALTLVSSVLLLVIAGLSLYRGVNFFSKLSYFLHYAMSAQSYGLRAMGWSSMPSYKMHYYVFPVVIGIVTVYLMTKYESLTKSYKLAYLSMIYMCLFYFVSFNRGIIRHSLLEGVDSLTSTFIYSIVPGLVYFVFRKHSHSLKFVLFITLGFFLINTYRLPEPVKATSPFEQMVEKLKNTRHQNLAAIKSRVLPPAPNSVAERDDFVNFIKHHTKADETYIDFSNRPMYHFFTQKETPAWFYQNPLCVRDDYLQDRFVADLANYKTPFLLFKGLNEQLYEGVDQVPNQVRHYRMVEYFYQHYTPYIILDGLCLWRAKHVTPDNRIDTIYHSKHASTPLLNPSKWMCRLGFDAQKRYLVKINYHKRPNNVGLVAYFSTKTLRTQAYLVNDTVAYCPLKTNGLSASSFLLEADNAAGLISELSVMACDYIPDFTAEHYLNYPLRQLPYIWGSYDKVLPTEKVLFHASKNVHPAGQLPSFVFPDSLDKSSGNTIVVSLTNSNKDSRLLNLSIGPKSGHLFTTMNFEALPSEKPQTYAFRVSSNYKWYAEPNCRGFIWANTGDMTGIQVHKIEITKGK